MSPANTCERHVGRLIEVRIEMGYRNPRDVDAIHADILSACSRVPGAPRVVLVTDWRNCTVMGEGAAQKLAAALRDMNSRVERGGALLPVTSSVAVLQFLRLLRENNNPNRRGFTDAEDLIAWLSEILTAEESARLQTFVG